MPKIPTIDEPPFPFGGGEAVFDTTDCGGNLLLLDDPGKRMATLADLDRASVGSLPGEWDIFD
jgi:hypothetical protein